MRSQCKDCLPLDKALQRLCMICGQTHVCGTRRITRICARCEQTRPPRIEHIVWEMIKEQLPPPYIRDDKLIGGDACASNRTRPDACWLLEDRIVHLEVDEHSHHDRDVSCELKKLDSANWGLAAHGFEHLPTFVIRFNPNEYDGPRTGLDVRCQNLVAKLDMLLHGSLDAWDPLRVNVCFMYYHSKGHHHIQAAREKPYSILVHEC